MRSITLKSGYGREILDASLDLERDPLTSGHIVQPYGSGSDT